MTYSPIAKEVFRSLLASYSPEQFASLEEDKAVVLHMQEQEKLIEERIKAKKDRIMKSEQEIDQLNTQLHVDRSKVQQFWKGVLYCNEKLPENI